MGVSSLHPPSPWQPPAPACLAPSLGPMLHGGGEAPGTIPVFMGKGVRPSSDPTPDSGAGSSAQPPPWLVRAFHCADRFPGIWIR